MEKEEIVIVAQLLTGIKDSLDALEEAKNKNNAERLSAAKKEIMNFQRQISKII